jgi:hypothetical protein
MPTKGKKDKSGCCPGVIPTPQPGWQMRLLDGCCRVEYIYKGPLVHGGPAWYWDLDKKRWIVPPGLPDPNPWTPEGVPLAGPGTM